MSGKDALGTDRPHYNPTSYKYNYILNTTDQFSDDADTVKSRGCNDLWRRRAYCGFFSGGA